MVKANHNPKVVPLKVHKTSEGIDGSNAKHSPQRADYKCHKTLLHSTAALVKLWAWCEIPSTAFIPTPSRTLKFSFSKFSTPKRHSTWTFWNRHCYSRLTSIYKNQPLSFQQDSTFSRGAKKNQDRQADDVPHFISKDEWSQTSPDLNYLNYCMQTVLESKFCNISSNSEVSKVKTYDRVAQNIIKLCVSHVSYWQSGFSKLYRRLG